MKFKRGDMVRNNDDNTLYCVISIPNTCQSIAGCSLGFYTYRSYNTDTDYKIWSMTQDEFERNYRLDI